MQVLQVEQRADNVRLAIILMCGAGLLFGISSAVLKFCSSSIPAMECAFARSIVGFVVLFAAHAISQQRHPDVRLGWGTNRRVLALRGILGATATVLYVGAIPRMDLALANGLNQTSPIFVCVFAALILKERYSWHIYALVLGAFFGIVLILRPDVSGVNPAALMALASAVLSGLAYTCVRILRRTESPQTIVMWLLGAASLMSLATIPFQPWVMPSPFESLMLMLVGLLAFAGQMLMTNAYRFAPATIVAPFIYVSTFSSLIIALVVWGEMPGWLALAGCAISIVCSVLIGVCKKS